MSKLNSEELILILSYASALPGVFYFTLVDDTSLFKETVIIDKVTTSEKVSDYKIDCRIIQTINVTNDPVTVNIESKTINIANFYVMFEEYIPQLLTIKNSIDSKLREAKIDNFLK